MLTSDATANNLAETRLDPARGVVTPPMTAHERVAEQFAALSPLEQGRALRAMDGHFGNRGVSDALARGDAPAQGPGGPPPEHCTLEVRYKPVFGPTNHGFIVTTDGNSQNYFRGGPQSAGAGLNSSSSRRRGEVEPGFGIYGPIVTEYGRYTQGTADWTTQPSGRQTVANVRGNCDALEADLARHMDDIEAARINYMPLAQNSNSTVREALERAGYGDVDPVVLAPAWRMQLPHP